MTHRRRARPPWPIQLAGLLAAMIGAALAVTAITHLIIGGAW